MPRGLYIVYQTLICKGVTSLLVHVNDIIVTENNNEEQKLLKYCSAKELHVKILERLKYFLGIKVAHSKHDIFISQQKYIPNLLRN